MRKRFRFGTVSTSLTAGGEAAQIMTPRNRMSGPERRDHILDTATALILDQGLSACSLEEVAARAGISKALIYKHFENREDLLKTLLERELAALRGRNLPTLDDDLPFAVQIRTGNERAFQYLHERGPILRRLFTEEVITGADQDQRRPYSTTRHYAEKIASTYGVSPELAFLGTLLTINAPWAASRAMKRLGVAPEFMADFWTTFILGGWAAASAQYAGRPGPALRDPEPGRRTPRKKDTKAE